MKILLYQELERLEEDIPDANNLKKIFCNLVVNVLFQTTRSFPTLLQVTKRLFPKYIEPVREGLCTASNPCLLYERIAPDLQIEHKFGSIKSDSRLPVQARYLLGAAFLASSNPQSSDEQMFRKERQFRRNSIKRIKSRQKQESRGVQYLSYDPLLQPLASKLWTQTHFIKVEPSLLK